MATSSNRSLILLVCILAVLISIVALFTGRVRDFEERIDSLEAEQRVLERAIEEQRNKNAELSSIISEKDNELRDLYLPQQIDGPAQFPINRVLAQENDTVASLASREKTTPDVIYALNPWLEGAKSLIKGQAIWIPSN